MPTKTIPAVSIIIPMYNTEKYIGETLDSILAQTFQDFEVIVVDDCSTDNSCAVVESYLPKFNAKGGGGKLQLIKSKKNSNTPGMPRNVGIRFSRGEYIFFLDSDDAITKTALEELYPVAKKFDADFLYCEKYYQIDEDEKFTTNKNLLQVQTLWGAKYDFVTKPKLVSNNVVDRIKELTSYKFAVTPWNYFFRRDFLSKYDIHFPNWKYAEDNLFIFYVLCRAEKIVRLPNILYLYRKRENSIMTNKSVEIEIHRYGDHIFKLISTIIKFAEEFPLLKEPPNLLYEVFKWCTEKVYGFIAPVYAQIPAWQIDPFIRKELDKIDDKTPLTAFLFSRMIIFNLQLNQSAAIIKQMNAQIQKQNQTIQNLYAQIKTLQAK